MTPRGAVTSRSRDDEMINFLNRPPSRALTPTVRQTSVFGTTERRAGGLERWRARYGAGEPDPWMQMKMAIFVVLALTVWSFYVVVGRVCTSMIRNRSSSGLGKATGVGALVGFVILWLMFIWGYIRIATTGPGFAREHIPKTPAPPSHGPSTDYIPYRAPASPGNPQTNSLSAIRDSSPQRTVPAAGPDPSEFAPIANLVNATLRSSDVPSSSVTLADQMPQSKTKNSVVQSRKDWREIERPLPRSDLGPRWCRFCEINKPDRTHHCRHCGTCVMQFDHHCLWIGQCFFIIFNFWASLFTTFMTVFLIIVTTRSSTIDGQIIALIAISALFCLFTAAMLFSHIHLILTGISTVESFAARDQHQREADVLQREYGYLWHNMEKKKVKKKWNEEWGGSEVHARWKFGTLRQMWEQEMGRNPIGWFLPIGPPLGDGIHFPSNPRFGPSGEWLRRKDWPKEVL
ncbi:MAG: hypothetical protein TREMPRED_005979 [Tremellales sp. Tagirdzhanova-0007]|nr:MAG: hypothetical protein TREMPRED_005979 [Tremellales sp. Tagirdzhanova-0007]